MKDQDTIIDLSRCLGRVEGKVDGIITRLDRINSLIDDHDKKINKCEDDLSTIKGSAALLGGGAGFTIVILWDIIKNKFFN